MPSKLDELKRRAQQTARDLDEKYKLKSKLDEGTRKTTEALRKGADVATATLDDARQEARRLNREHRITERVSDTARRAANATDDALNKAGVKKKVGEVVDSAGTAAREAGSRAADAATDAREKAADLFGEARRYYEQAAEGGVVTGLPLSLVLGGNPLLASIWLFGNGLICFHNGYKFFMMAIGDKEEVARVVRDIKGLLPEITIETVEA